MINQPQASRHYTFGTFDERLAHICAALEIDPPKIAYGDGEVLLTDALMGWIETHEVNMDWLFSGNPCAMVRTWSKSRGGGRRLLEIEKQLEPEVQAGMRALLRAVVENKLPIEEPLQIFDKVVKDWRAAQAA
ncbi:MAG: hypothetical protein AAF755_00150 [Pseudomonadota bacterium]